MKDFFNFTGSISLGLVATSFCSLAFISLCAAYIYCLFLFMSPFISSRKFSSISSTVSSLGDCFGANDYLFSSALPRSSLGSSNFIGFSHTLSVSIYSDSKFLLFISFLSFFLLFRSVGSKHFKSFINDLPFLPPLFPMIIIFIELIIFDESPVKNL